MSSPQNLRVEKGRRTGRTIIVCIDSTTLGSALGGCRIRSYTSWQDGVRDAVRLAAAMTEKAALAGLAHGGGKTVVALDPHDAPLTGASRRELLHDIGDVVESLDGQYWTGPDVGSSPEDMAVISERTEHVFCRPQRLGGSGDSSGPTAAGVLACIQAVREHVLAGQPLTQTSFSIVGLGHVGQLVAEHLASSGARLIVSDIDPRRRELAQHWHAGWLEPDEALLAEVDVLVPAAVGGVLTPPTVAALRCRAVVGPANNQLDADSTADLLHARGITWAPDTLVSAGGIVAATGHELQHLPDHEIQGLLAGIGDRLGDILQEAHRKDQAPLQVARQQAKRRLARAQLPTYS